ncbi:DUF3866 family protein [Leekyejoonella antrihumi]|uniref:DUF3866 family protein n=1 Tax=Leekyejoonella antrihumi TaxID=1660198 RepID=A0A563E4R4_9MICO|nr:DUF3866 family protein [Leekyejoonella antrihumi]TWP36864.1 DUF3866 family protein [Leekyejoonella antrihumi]
MITWRAGIVQSIHDQWTGVVVVDVAVAEPGDSGAPGSAVRRALAYTELVGAPQPGDRVLLNTAAQARGLGTGGLALVVALPDRLPADPAPSPGHIVKARYTPLQEMMLGVDEQESPHHAVLAGADSIDGMPVIVADLHSAVPAIIAGLRAACRVTPRVAYVMTDGGALPIAFSRTVHDLRGAGWIIGAVTVGQAFGGDLEAVNVHTGLLAARLVLRADVVVVSQGPGNLGTGTRWGFSGTSAGEAINAAGALGGRPVASLRVSQADRRERHRGVSHHSTTAYGRVALVEADLPVPTLAGDLGDQVNDQADRIVQLSQGRMRRFEVPVDGLLKVLRECPASLRTMGRGLDEDPASFLAAAAAGRHAAPLL